METKESQFEHFVETNKGIIFRVCYMFSKDKVDADDLFQEILIRLWEGFETYNHKSKESTWVYQVALNTAINISKREQRRIKTAPEVDTELEKYVLEQIELRKAAKKEKNFAEADRIRAELLDKGIVLEDTREGVKWHLK